jgi:hypothetical protein
MPALLNAAGSVTLDASGDGQVSLGPSIPGVLWTVTTVGCFTSTAVNTPTFYIYYGNAAAFNFIAASYTGNLDSDSDISLTLYTGQTLLGVWAGGDSGAQATMSIFGTFTAPGNQ